MKFLKTESSKCRGHLVCTRVCSELYFKENNPEKSAIRIEKTTEGFSVTACNQCGRCVAECPTLALSINKLGVVMLNKSMCIGCFACIGACPTNAMMRYPGAITPHKCIACGACAKQCPERALEVVTKES